MEDSEPDNVQSPSNCPALFSLPCNMTENKSSDSKWLEWSMALREVMQLHFPDPSLDSSVQSSEEDSSIDADSPNLRPSILLDGCRRKDQFVDMKPYDIEYYEPLGHGNGGTVYKVLHLPTQTWMALKTLHVDFYGLNKNTFVNEIKALRNCFCPFIVSCIGAFLHQGDVHLCMELMDAGSLDSVLRRKRAHASLYSVYIPERILQYIIFCTLEGLVYLHERLGIIHRDVKPSNILLHLDGSVKLCDLGVSGKLVQSTAKSYVGTSAYMAPERILGQEYSSQADSWSLGMTILELALGQFPLQLESESRVSSFASSTVSSVRSSCLSSPMVSPTSAAPSNLVQGGYTHTMASRSRRRKGSLLSPVSLFEQLTWIVNESMPSLPAEAYSKELCDFVDDCMIKDPVMRPNPQLLLCRPMLDPFRESPTYMLESQSMLSEWLRELKISS